MNDQIKVMKKLAVISSLFFLTLLPGCNDSTKESSSMPEAQILDQEWYGMPAGDKVFDKSGKVMGTIKRDLAGVKITLQVRNPSSNSIRIKGPIFLVNPDGERVRILKWTQVGDDPEFKYDKGVKIKPKKTETIYLDSSLSDEVLKEKGALFVSHGQYDWNLKLEKMPSLDVLFRKRESLGRKSKLALEARILNQQWYGMPKGAKVYLADSKETVINSDVVGVKISLELRNLSTVAQNLNPPIVLVESDGSMVRTFHLTRVGDKPTTRDSPTVIRFKPHETKTLHLDSGMSSKIINHQGDLFVSHRKYGWKLKIDPQPPVEILF